MPTQSILVVDDEPSIREVVSLYLRRAGYFVTVAKDGRSALRALNEERYDLVVLDIMLPAVDGLEITRRVRSYSNTPIILLTAKRTEADRIAGLDMGADDYVVKPFSPQELVSRVRAVLRRTQHGVTAVSSAVATPLIFANLHIDPSSRTVTAHGNDISLTAKEFDLLWVFASRPRQVFSRDQLLDQVWGMAEYVDPSTVTVHVRRVREKIERNPSKPEFIHTVWGVGYKFDAQEAT